MNFRFCGLVSKEFLKRETSQVMHEIASNIFQQNRCAYGIQKVIEATFSQGHWNFGRTKGIQFT